MTGVRLYLFTQPANMHVDGTLVFYLGAVAPHRLKNLRSRKRLLGMLRLARMKYTESGENHSVIVIADSP